MGRVTRSVLPLAGAAVLIAALLLLARHRVRERGAEWIPETPLAAMMTPAMAARIGEADHDARADPWSADRVGELGRTYHANLFSDRARQCYLRAEALEPDSARWPYHRALLFVYEGRLWPLIEALERVVTLDPEHALAWYRLGEARWKAGRVEGAEEAYRRALDLLSTGTRTPAGEGARAPLVAHVRLGLSRTAEQAGDEEGARKLLLQAVEIAPGLGTAHRLLVDLYRRADREEEAARHQAAADTSERFAPPADPEIEALTRISANSTFLLREASLEEVTGDLDRALELTRRAVEVAPTDPDAVTALAHLEVDAGRPERALPALLHHRRQVEPDHRNVGNWLITSISELYRGSPGTEVLLGVERELRETLAVDPDPVVTGCLGAILLKLGRAGQAVPVLTAALAEEPDLFFRAVLGIALGEVGDEGAGIEELSRVLEREPDHLFALSNLVGLLFKANRLPEALVRARRLVELVPEDARAHLTLADLAARTGGAEEARRHLERGLELDPRARVEHIQRRLR